MTSRNGVVMADRMPRSRAATRCVCRFVELGSKRTGAQYVACAGSGAGRPGQIGKTWRDWRGAYGESSIARGPGYPPVLSPTPSRRARRSFERGLPPRASSPWAGRPMPAHHGLFPQAIPRRLPPMVPCPLPGDHVVPRPRSGCPWLASSGSLAAGSANDGPPLREDAPGTRRRVHGRPALASPLIAIPAPS